MKRYILTILSLFILSYINLQGQSKYITSGLTTHFIFTPNKSNLGYIYNRAIDIIMHRHEKVFVSMSETDKIDTPIFEANRDSVIVNPELNSTYTLFSPRFMDSLCNFQTALKLHKNDKVFKSLSFNNSFITKMKKDNHSGYRNGNIYIKFSHIVQLNNVLSFGAEIDWVTMEEGIYANKFANLIFELELCNNEYFMFRKLYTNYFGTMNAGDISLEIKNYKELPPPIDNTPLQMYINETKNGGAYYFYEIELRDKACGE